MNTKKKLIIIMIILIIAIIGTTLLYIIFKQKNNNILINNFENNDIKISDAKIITRDNEKILSFKTSVLDENAILKNVKINVLFQLDNKIIYSKQFYVKELNKDEPFIVNYKLEEFNSNYKDIKVKYEITENLTNMTSSSPKAG